MHVLTLSPTDTIPSDTILPKQTHSTNISQIITGNEELTDTDGIWTQDSSFKLGVRTADCAPVVFVGEQRFGVAHAGWKGLVGYNSKTKQNEPLGVVEKMLDVFKHDLKEVYIEPNYPVFKIRRDFCFDSLKSKFGIKYFNFTGNTIEFKLKSALLSILEDFRTKNSLEFKIVDSGISTFETLTLASWRRDQNRDRNTTIVYS